MQVDQVAASAPAELKFDDQRLAIFYDHIFPYKMFFKWLSYD